MKKIFTSFFVLAASLSFAQGSLRFLEHGSNTPAQTVYTINTSTTAGSVYELDIQNLSSNNMNIRIRKTIVSTPAGCATPNDIIFCDPINCYSNPSTNLGFAFAINANQTLDPAAGMYGLKADLLAGNCTGTYVVRYRVYDASNQADSASVSFVYNVTPTSIATIDAKNFVMSSAFPNPADGVATIKYDFPSAPAVASIKIFNMVGTMVKEAKLEGEEGKVAIETSSLSEGVYFYSLIVNNKTVSTKKLVVTH